jgi:hypothetical protein
VANSASLASWSEKETTCGQQASGKTRGWQKHAHKWERQLVAFRCHDGHMVLLNGGDVQVLLAMPVLQTRSPQKVLPQAGPSESPPQEGSQLVTGCCCHHP